jgi:hypothetical protein
VRVRLLLLRGGGGVVTWRSSPDLPEMSANETRSPALAVLLVWTRLRRAVFGSVRPANVIGMFSTPRHMYLMAGEACHWSAVASTMSDRGQFRCVPRPPLKQPTGFARWVQYHTFMPPFRRMIC